MSVPFHSASFPPGFIGHESTALCPRLDRALRAVGLPGQTESGRIMCVSSNYWSATTNANNTDNAWKVNFNNGNDNNNNKTNHNYVRCVRGGV